MEIRIKTEEEFRADHVRIEIDATRVEAGEVAARLLTPEPEIGISADRLLELSNRAAMAEALAAQNKSLNAMLDETERAEDLTDLRAQLHEYNRDRITERDRADANMNRITELTAELAMARDECAQLRGQLKNAGEAQTELAPWAREAAGHWRDKLMKISEVVNGPKLQEALSWPEDSPEFVTLRDTVRRVRNILMTGEES